MTREEKLEAAGAYVLGDMDEPARAALEAQFAGDPELREAVDRLTRQMHALDDTATPEAVSDGLWARIEAQLGDAPPTAAGPPVAARPIPTRARSMGWMAIAASVVVAAGIGYLAGSAGKPEPVVIAVLMNEADASPGAIIEAFADDSVTIVPLENFTVPEGQVMQVWTLPDADTGPVSLGTLEAAGNIRLAGPDLPVPAAGQLYEITLEPSPGSPTGRPTGPILVKGFARPPL